jgi:hypothetical protein
MILNPELFGTIIITPSATKKNQATEEGRKALEELTNAQPSTIYRGAIALSNNIQAECKDCKGMKEARVLHLTYKKNNYTTLTPICLCKFQTQKPTPTLQPLQTSREELKEE